MKQSTTAAIRNAADSAAAQRPSKAQMICGASRSSLPCTNGVHPLYEKLCLLQHDCLVCTAAPMQSPLGKPHTCLLVTQPCLSRIHVLEPDKSDGAASKDLEGCEAQRPQRGNLNQV